MCWSREWINDIDMTRFDPYPIQFANIDRIECNNVVYNFDETGSGKTISAGLMALHYLHNNPPEKRVLVLTIPSLISSKQFEEDWYDKLPFKNPYVDGRIVFSNDVYSNINKYNGEWGMIILDEAHRYLQAEKRREALMGLSTDKLVFMTATPIKQLGYCDFRNYCDLAEKLLGYPVDCTWIDHIAREDRDPICSTFDVKSPVTRYFKDTITALEYVEGGKIDFKKTKSIRKVPEIWRYETHQKIPEMVSKILQIVRPDTGGCGKEKNRFVIFTRLIQDEAVLIEDYLRNDSEHFCEFSQATDAGEKLSYARVDGSTSTLYRVGDFSDNGDTKRLPDILIITYQIAEAGVNLPGYNYVINYHIPAYPSALEQRFGRIDRMGKKNGTHYAEIHMIFLLSKQEMETNKQNFYYAVFIYKHMLLSVIPAKNILLTKEIISEQQDELSLLQERYDALYEQCKTPDGIRKAIEELEEEANSELAQFCQGQELVPGEDKNMDEFQDEVLERLKELKNNLNKLDEKLGGAELEQLLEKIQDRIYYFGSDDQNGIDGVHTLDAIRNDSGTGCAEKIYELDEYKNYAEYFEKSIRTPLRLAEVRKTYKDRVEEFFEEQFMKSIKDKYGVEYGVEYGENNYVGTFEKIFTHDYKSLLMQELFADVQDAEKEDVRLFCDYCTKTWVETLPFFEMCKQYGKLLNDRIINERGSCHVLWSAYYELKEENMIPKRLADCDAQFETFLVRKVKKDIGNGWCSLDYEYECSNWFKLAFHCFQNSDKDGIMDLMLEYVEVCSDNSMENLERMKKLEEEIPKKIIWPALIDKFYDFFFTNDLFEFTTDLKRYSWRYYYKVKTWSCLLPRVSSGRGSKQMEISSDNGFNIKCRDFWTRCIFKLLMVGSNIRGCKFGSEEWLKDIRDTYKVP